MKLAAQQLLRAIRGSRSQLAFSRRLGYRSAVAADWEAGRRSPTAHETLRACELVGIDVVGALDRFQPDAAARFKPTPSGVAAWLRALQGTTTQVDLAARTGLSRFQVARALSGESQPRLPQFLSLTDALTGRVPELVSTLVPIERVPALAARFRAASEVAALAWEVPWSMPVLMRVEAGVPVDDGEQVIAASLGIPVAVAETCVSTLSNADLIQARDGMWTVADTPSIRTPDPDTHRAWLRHWWQVAAERTGAESVANVNVFACSRADLQRIRELQAATFQEIRGIIARSEPSETVGLLIWQTTELASGGAR